MLALAPVSSPRSVARTTTAEYAVTYIRIVALGLPAVFLTLGGQGFLRGVSDLRSPLLVVIAGNALNVVLELLFVYGLDWGVAGSAAGTAIAQTGMGLAMAALVLRRIGRRYIRCAAFWSQAAVGWEVHLRPHVRADRGLRPRRRRRRAIRRCGARRVPDLVPALPLPRTCPRRDRNRWSDHRREGARWQPGE